ncbi:MAG: hypothetical protein VXW46_05020 [Pseudomonadota bacterium]|nr:hypothetical protein [Pseudomonadota bacterium]
MKNLFRMSMLTFALLGWQSCAMSPPKGDSAKLTPTDAEVEQYNARVAPEERIVCRLEKPVGTYIAKRVCRLQVDVDATSSLHRQQLRRVLN